ncbi:MAG: AMP-binding protein, partial [Actinobacteria bacterium]|nr:AMP-binding protein [Actinomycetota bacterium]
MVSLADQVTARRAALEDRHRPWRPRTLTAVLDMVAAQYPERPYVITEHETLSYAELTDWSVRLARGLVASGLRSGERVGLFLPNGAAMIAARFAAARAGAVAVPISFRLHARELAQLLTLSEASALISMEGFREVDALAALDDIAPGWDQPGGQQALPHLRLVVTVPEPGTAARRSAVPATLGQLERGPDPALDAELAGRIAAARPEDTSIIFYTSGTTGLPKGVLYTHDMELRSGYGSAYTRAFEDGRRMLFALPLNHCFAYIEGLVAALFAAGTVVVQATFDPAATLAAIERYQVGEALFVPTMSLAVVAAARTSDRDVSCLHSVMSAASAAPASLWAELAKLLGVEQLVTAYGMTETAAASTFTLPGGPVDDLEQTVGYPKPGGIASDPALDGRLIEYKTVDPVTGDDLPPGAEGELAARGPIITPGYFRQPDATAAAMLPGGWLRSGDLGYLRADGALVLTGRAKDLYKCGGELVTPAEVEEFLNRRPDVVQAFVVGVPDTRMGEVGCAWVVPETGADLDAAEIIEQCRTELARFKVPAYILTVRPDELPLTASGKVQ